MTALVLVVFTATYAGMALGRWPGLRIDRTGIAVLGAIVLLGSGAIDRTQAVAAIDFPTLAILFGLMILSAQFTASGFYDWCALRIATAARSPAVLLAVVVAVAGGLSAVLANDVVVFAMTPMLCAGLRARAVDPRPFLIALAGAANAGSAATIIGNPQNILIGQVGRLEFWPFVAACGVPALAGLASVYGVVWAGWRHRFRMPDTQPAPLPEAALARWHLGKGLVATVALLALFAAPLPHETGVLAVAGALLVSRSLASRTMLGMVDWHLLVLFAGLFVVTRALSATGLPAEAITALEAAGLLPDTLAVMAPLTLAGSNTIGNVPAVILILSVWPGASSQALYGLAVLSTLAGNFLLIGSMANLIVAERAQTVGVTLGFVEHAKCGVPITVLSLVAAMAWLWVTGMMPLG